MSGPRSKFVGAPVECRRDTAVQLYGTAVHVGIRVHVARQLIFRFSKIELGFAVDYDKFSRRTLMGRQDAGTLLSLYY